MIAAVSLERRREGLHISASALRVLQECPREWWLRYVEGVPREDVSAGIVLGSAIHEALAAFYRGLRDDDPPGLETLLGVASASITSAIDSELPVLFREGDDEHSLRELAARLLEAFVREGFRPARVLAVELPFGLPVVHPETGEVLPYEERIVGAIDLIAEDADGTIVVVDHKTAARADKEKAKRADTQMSLYAIATKKLLGIDEPDLRYQNLIKTKTARVESQEISRGDRDETEAIEAVASGLELINLAVAHPNGKGLMGRRRSWRCKECSYRRRCGGERR